jgi:hypothetical protein
MFKNAPILGVKYLDYLDFCKVAALKAEGKHLSHKGLEQIKLTKDKMNTKRKFP